MERLLAQVFAMRTGLHFIHEVLGNMVKYLLHAFLAQRDPPARQAPTGSETHTKQSRSVIELGVLFVLADCESQQDGQFGRSAGLDRNLAKC